MSTFKHVQGLFAENDATIIRSKENYNLYTVTLKGQSNIVYFTIKMDEVISEVKHLKISGFCQKYAKGNKVAKTKTVKAKKDFNFERPIALENRRRVAIDLNSKVENSSASLHEVIHAESKLDVAQDTIEHFQNLRIDYLNKIPKEYKEGNKTYFFPDCTKNILHRLQLGRNIFITGRSGCGKSDFVKYLSHHVGQKMLRINFSTGTTESHLLGKFIVRDGKTQFVYGVIPIAMKMGWWICFDEIDYAQPEHLSILQPVLEGDNLILTQNENEEIIPHENFRIFATANTKGRGDETQSYVGTNFLNLSFLDRWSFFEFDFTKEEGKIISSLLSKDPILADQVSQFFQLLRKSVDNGELMNIEFTTRRLQQVCEMLAFGESLQEVLQFELYSRYDSHEKEIIQEFATDIWNKMHYLSKDWSIGDEHYVAPEIPGITVTT